MKNGRLRRHRLAGQRAGSPDGDTYEPGNGTGPCPGGREMLRR